VIKNKSFITPTTGDRLKLFFVKEFIKKSEKDRINKMNNERR
jgi:hypothetical protein